MRRTFACALLGLWILSLTACQNTDRNYVTPNLTAQSAAIITGSKSHNPDPTATDTRVYLVSIDDKLTLDGPFGWDHRTIVVPGTHMIQLGVSRTKLFYKAFGFGQIQVTLEAGKTYVLRATEPVTTAPNCARSTGWIESDDGTPIGDKVSVMVATNTGGEIPIAGGGFVTIPSRTNCPPQ